jgi:2-(1,2-epoxy-1,2-dihydrophenyl)acetyl-CoA isomerase
VSDIDVERDASGVVRVSLNRPERKNAMLPTMWGELTGILREIDRREDDRVVVLTGAGVDFCSGSDIAARRNGAVNVMSTEDLMAAVAETVLTLWNLTKPTIAAVDGVAAGGGCNLALGCDIVVASERARFSEIFVRRGLVVDTGGSWILPQLVGLANAKRLVLTGDIIDAQEAARIGFVSKVVAAQELAGEVGTLASRIALHDPDVLAANKRLLHTGVELGLADALDAESAAQLTAISSPNTTAALQKFLEKR